jgi:hypothetical protein
MWGRAALPPRMPTTTLDTLGPLYATGHGLFGSCTDCAKLYRMDAPPEQRISSNFDIDLAKLVAERGADCSIIRMEPVSCPKCGSLLTECRITTPK